MKQYYLKPNFQVHYERLCEDVTRSLVKSLLNSKTLDEKLTLSKAAILSKKLRVRSTRQDYEESKQNLIQKKISTKDAWVETQEFGPKFEVLAVECQTNQVSSYLKQTHQIQTQTQVEELYYGECSFAQIQLGQSKVSAYSKYSEDLGTCCSFANELEAKPKFLKKKMTLQEQIVLSQLQAEVDSLKGQVVDLKSQIQIIDEEKNKWKRKALKSSTKIKLIQNEQVRFQKAYEGTAKQQ